MICRGSYTSKTMKIFIFTENLEKQCFWRKRKTYRKLEKILKSEIVVKPLCKQHCSLTRMQIQIEN